MYKTNCYLCGKELSGGLDTYGWPDDLCWDCYAEQNSYGDGQAWYGLAPHHHDLSITGSVIGSTVFDLLPEPNANGEYEIDDYLFVPTEADGKAGLWSRKPLPGWR